MAFKPLKLIKGALGLATSNIPFGGVVKGILGFAAKKIPGAEKVLEQVFNEAEAMYRERKDIRDAYLTEMKEQNKFYIESEGRYGELRTRAEGIIRSMQRPFLTVLCVVNLIIFIYAKISFPDIFGIITAGLVASLAGTKALRDYKAKK
jgi:HEPN domain-containing protein